MKLIEPLTLCLSVIFLFGCATAAKMENMALDTTTPQKSYDPALKNQVGVAEVTGGTKTNPAWTSEIDNTAFSGAVKASLESQGLYADDGQYQLTITLMKVEQPLFSFDTTVTTQVRYVMKDTESGKTVLDETIAASHTATVGDAFLGVDRLRYANEGSAKKNIEGLLVKLDELKISAGQVKLPINTVSFSSILLTVSWHS